MLELVLWDVAKVEARDNVIWFVNQGTRVYDHPFQINPHEQRLPPLLNFVKEAMEHDPDATEGYSVATDDDRVEVVNEICNDSLLLVLPELLEQIPAVVDSREDIV